MNIIIDIKKDGQIILLTENNKTYLYGSINQYKDVLKVILNSQQEIENKNGNIKFNDGEHYVTIKNYLYNNNSFLKGIIAQAKKILNERILEELRQKKITRKVVFLSATIVSLGAFIASVSTNGDGLKPIEIEPIESDPIIQIYTEDELNDLPFDYSVDESEDNITLEENEQEQISEDILITQDYGSRINTDKYKIAKEKYYNYIVPIAKEYGIDPNLVLAIATQESGIHNVDRKGPAMGLMQIELSVWDNKDIYAYNHNNRKIEKVHITKEKLKDVSFNIRVGCMIFQNYLKQSNNNLEVAIQMYNYGPGNVKKAFRSYYNNPKLSLDEALADYDSGWLTKRETIKAGDKEYLEHVLSYVEDLEDIMCFDSKDNEVRYNGYSKHL